MVANVPKTIALATVVMGPVTLSFAVPTTLTMLSVAWTGQSSVRTRAVERSTWSATARSVVCGSCTPIRRAVEPQGRARGRSGRAPVRARRLDPRRVRVQRRHAHRRRCLVRVGDLRGRDRDRRHATSGPRGAHRRDGRGRVGMGRLRVVGEGPAAVSDRGMAGDGTRWDHRRLASGAARIAVAGNGYNV